MKELFVGDDPLEAKTMQTSDVEIYKVDANGDCLYSAVLGLYSATVQFQVGMELQDRMNAVQAQYWRGTTFRAKPHYLRMLFAKYLYENWEHYYTNDVFKERLLSVARLESPHLLTEYYTPNQIRDAYIFRMTSREELAGNVECDIASELFGMKIEVYAIIDTLPDLLYRHSTFEPHILSPVPRPMTAWKWCLLQDNNNHFNYVQPWLGSMESAADNPLAEQVNEIDPGALRKLRTLARTRANMSFSAFQVWFNRYFGSLDRAVVQLALPLFFAALTCYFVTKKDRASSSQAPVLIEEIGPPLPMGTSVVDEVFDKHNVQKRIDGVQAKGRGCARE